MAKERKIQKTGGSLSISLPKQWVESNHLTQQSTVRVTQTAENDLLLSVQSAKSSLQHRIIQEAEVPLESLHRQIIAHYTTGADTITIKGALTQVHRQEIRKTADMLINLEVIGETSEQMLLQYADNAAMVPENALENMLDTTLAMVRDACRAFLESNPDLGHDVAERDSSVDRLYFMILRGFNNVLLHRTTSTTPLHIAYVQSLSFHVERIADHARRVALSQPTKPISPTMRRLLTVSSQELMRIMKDTFSIVRTHDNTAAHHIFPRIEKLETQLRELRTTLRKHPSVELLAVRGSLDRMCGYLTNCAEITIMYGVVDKKHQSKKS